MNSATHTDSVIPCVIWMTGLSGAGKTTIACCVESQLQSEGVRCFRLDGDELRQGLNSDLGFSDADRIENIRRVAEVAKLMNSAGLCVIVSLISPLQMHRDMAKACIGEFNFLDVFIDTPLHIAEKRDPKGLYKKARQGLIRQFTGLDAPYERPHNPAIHIQTMQQSADEAAVQIIEHLRRRAR